MRERPEGKSSAQWQQALYRARIAWRGPACWHWRYYGTDYRALREEQGWAVQALGKQYPFPDLQDWLAPAGVIHIVLSGPSIASLGDTRRLGSAPTLVVNGSWRVMAEAGLRADLYLVSDVGFVRRQWDVMVRGIQNSRALAVDHRVLLEILRRDPSLIQGRDVRLFDNLTRPFGRSAYWWRAASRPRVAVLGQDACFSMDAQFGYHPSCTVAYLALQIAATQAPRRIVFFGLDLSGGARFYAEAVQEKSMLDQDYERCIEPHFRFASDVLSVAGIEVLNASPNSRLPDAIFPRVPPDAALARDP